MKLTQTYRNQHDEIRRAGNDLSVAMRGDDPAAVRRALSRLSGLLEVHLALEDKSFYPVLLKHADPEVRKTAQSYQESMGTLATAYMAFRGRWLRQGAIEEDRPGFEKELNAVWALLDQRIDLENDTLYAMVDGLSNVAV